LNTGVTAETNATTYRLRAQHFSGAHQLAGTQRNQPFIKGRSYFIHTERAAKTSESPVAALLSCWRKWQSAFSDSTIYANAQMEIKFIKNQSQEWLARNAPARALCTPFCFAQKYCLNSAFAPGRYQICASNKLSSVSRRGNLKVCKHSLIIRHHQQHPKE
jgi:hypothetical protein